MRPLCQRLQRQGFNGDGRTDRASLQPLHVSSFDNGRLTVRSYNRYTSRSSGTDAQIVRPYKGLHVSPTEEIGNRYGANEKSPRRVEIKVRKNEMKLRKKQIKVRKNFSVPPWRFRNPSEGISDFLGGVGD